MGKTVVVSSHILAELAELCDSIGIIERGQLITSGTVEEVSRQVTQGRTIQIKTLSEVEAVQNILKNHPGVGQIYPINGLLEIEYAGDDVATADLLKVLITAGIRVISFTETSSDLEDIFLRLTKGEVA
jgi:ABC-2 type transport system ATP-binding protein